MKYGILLSGILLIIAACNKEGNLGAPPVGGSSDPPLNPYTGTYIGKYSESNNGVDSNGVFKNDTSYTMTIRLADGGLMPATPKNVHLSTITITKGPLVITSVPVDKTGHFAFSDFNHDITGYFVSDSLYLFSNSLNGAYDSTTFIGSWFVIRKLKFEGMKEL